MEEFEFVFFLFTFEQLFAHTDVVFDILQHKSMDIAFCKRRIENLLQIIDKLKVESVFDKIYTRADTQTEDPDVILLPVFSAANAAAAKQQRVSTFTLNGIYFELR